MKLKIFIFVIFIFIFLYGCGPKVQFNYDAPEGFQKEDFGRGERYFLLDDNEKLKQ